MPAIGCDNAARLAMRVALDEATLRSSNLELCRNEQCSRAFVTRMPDAGGASVWISFAGAVTGSAALRRDPSGGISIAANSSGTGAYPHGLIDGDRYALRVLGAGGSKLAETSFVAKFTDAPPPNWPGCPLTCRTASHDGGPIAVDAGADAPGSD